MKKTENLIGFALLALSVVLGKMFLASDALLLRLLIGMALGYTLTRAYTGFAGGVNRAYKTGSTRLMKALMFMFFITSVIVAAMLYRESLTGAITYGLWINPISLGLLVGGTLFGFGMALASACASGVMTDVVTAFPRGILSLFGFSGGVFLGYPLAATSFTKTSLLPSTATVVAMEKSGVFFPDLFVWDGFNGYLGAIVLTGVLALVVVYLSNLYESKRRKEGTYLGCDSEIMQDAVAKEAEKNELATDAQSIYQKLFVNPWSLTMGAVVIALLFAVLMGMTNGGWGASGPYGIWFAKFLMLFGFSPETLAAYSKVMSPEAFAAPFFSNGSTVQNVGIFLGTFVYLFTAGKFSSTVSSELKITLTEGALFLLGGVSMGVGTRLAAGCNVGALYTPISQFSMAGWVFLVVMVIGGVLGNIFGKTVLKK